MQSVFLCCSEGAVSVRRDRIHRAELLLLPLIVPAQRKESAGQAAAVAEEGDRQAPWIRD